MNTDFDHFGLTMGMVFKGTMRVCIHIYIFNSKGTKIYNLSLILLIPLLVLLAFTPVNFRQAIGMSTRLPESE